MLETDPIQSMLPLLKYTDLLCGKIPLGVEEVVLVLGEDGDIILLHNGGIWALLDHLQVDSVRLIWPGKVESSVPKESSTPSGAYDSQPQGITTPHGEQTHNPNPPGSSSIQGKTGSDTSQFRTWTGRELPGAVQAQRIWAGAG